MEKRPYVLVKCAMSIDGYIDDCSSERLILSNERDFAKVDEERAKYDAILIGAETVRKDNPRLLLKSSKFIEKRLKDGKTRYPAKVTITSTGEFSKDSNFINVGETRKIVYCSEFSAKKLIEKFKDKIEVVSLNESEINPQFILQDLKEKGINKLMIEGGSKIITMFLSKGLVDEIQVSIAPFFVGEEKAPKFVNCEKFPFNKNKRMKLINSEMIDDMVLLTYKLK